MRAIRRQTRPAVLVPLAAAALLLGACSGGGGDAEEPTATASAAEETDEPTAEPTEDDGGDAAASGGAGCVEGVWVSDAEEQAAATTSALGMSDLGAQATVSGDSLTTIADGTMTTQYRDQVVEVSWEMEGQEFRMVNSWSGTLTAAIEVTNEQVVISAVDSSALEMTYETYVNGEQLDVPGLEDIPLSGMAAGGTSTYTCSGDELRLTPVVEGMDTSAMVTVLHREG
ncbi:hypothetical protein [Actinotalea fermentans]|uniref:Lipoprotein n=1 Tax=Actinotalea fermentans TaxID=43671 RepID=A0A511YY14_9CELL|nr:hypothetical protein [Actinotalea fermentans]KGM15326.1 hypothetical protein N867_09660 [Actinotalea fermentans ATCC 43279 = JCM 9966 = DSM 3133]GEN80079.1 hypothetical protein AFE02nite_18130 [Actinotalea fermentans]